MQMLKETTNRIWVEVEKLQPQAGKNQQNFVGNENL